MAEIFQSYSNQHEDLSQEERDRAVHADEVCCKACEDSGVKVACLQEFGAWQEYVDGKINETRLAEEARGEVEKLKRSFAKYLVVEKEDPKYSEEEAGKKARVRSANKIYKEVCNDAGLTVCFFHDFGTWSDYVKGNLSESEFYQKARVEVEKMTADAV